MTTLPALSSLGRFCLPRLALLLSIFAIPALLSGQTNRSWDGGATDPASSNNDGLWNTADNWSGDAIPDGEATLGNVTANGSSDTPTRTVSIDATPSTQILRLNMTQTTADFVNRLDLTGGTLTIQRHESPITQTLGAGLSPDSLVINMSGSARINITGVFANQPVFSFTNRGVFNLTGNSTLTRLSNGDNITNFTWANTGVINMHGGDTTTGVLFGLGATGTTLLRGANPALDNTGQVNVTGGLATIGVTTNDFSTGNVTVNNNAGGTISVADGAILRINPKSRSSSGSSAIVANNQNAVFTIGEEADSTGSGLLQFNQTRVQSPSGNPTRTQRFNNSGQLNILGASIIELTGDAPTLEFNNLATGVVNLNHTSRIGTTDKATAFNNEGTFTKTGSGVAEIRSNTSGTAQNTGTMIIDQGTLLFSTSLTNAGTISGGGTLQTSGITSTSGAINPGNSIGTLTFALNSTSNVIDFGANTVFNFELGTPDGTPGVNNDLVHFLDLALNGDNVTFNNNVINFSNAGGLAAGSYTLLTFDQSNAYSGQFILGSGLEDFVGSYLAYGSNSIQLTVIPEPSSLSLVLLTGAGALMILRRRRRDVISRKAHS